MAGKRFESKYKLSHTFEYRQKEAAKVRQRHPDRLPVICEKVEDSPITELDKSKYLVPADLSIGQFVVVLRKRVMLDPEKAVFLFIGESVPPNAAQMSDLYARYKDEDGFLYIKYSVNSPSMRFKVIVSACGAAACGLFGSAAYQQGTFTDRVSRFVFAQDHALKESEEDETRRAESSLKKGVEKDIEGPSIISALEAERSRALGAGLRDCIAFFDAHTNDWNVEMDDFSKSTSEASKKKARVVVDSNSVEVMLLRSSALYRPPDGTPAHRAAPAPVMRVVGFLPFASPEQVHRHLTDLTLRQRWDKNYKFFRRWDAPQSADENSNKNSNSESESIRFLSQMSGIERPFKKVPVCCGDVCELKSIVSSEVVDHGWYAHSVGHSLLEKLGIAGRLFVYERRSTRYTLSDPNGKDEKKKDTFNSNSASSSSKNGKIERTQSSSFDVSTAYDVLYRGLSIDDDESSESKNALLSDSNVPSSSSFLAESLKSWISKLVSENSSQHCFINYQHILLLPVANVETQLQQQQQQQNSKDNPKDLFRQLHLGGSVENRETSNAVVDLLVENNNHIQNQKEKENNIYGTLLIMSSANDANIPATMPMWAQRRAASFFSRHAYNELLRDIRAYELEEEKEKKNEKD